jgi:hypothetical protein
MTCDPFAAPERVTVAEAFGAHAGVDLLASIGAGGQTDRDALAAAARRAGIRVAEDDTWADVFSRVIVEKVEPNLGIGRATILCEYPDRRGGPGPAQARRPARGRALRALCLRRRAGQRLRRTDRRRRAAPPLRGRDGREGPGLRRTLSAGRGLPGGAGDHARGVGLGPGLRPAGDAGGGGVAGGSGAVDAGGGVGARRSSGMTTVLRAPDRAASYARPRTIQHAAVNRATPSDTNGANPRRTASITASR